MRRAFLQSRHVKTSPKIGKKAHRRVFEAARDRAKVRAKVGDVFVEVTRPESAGSGGGGFGVERECAFLYGVLEYR